MESKESTIVPSQQLWGYTAAVSSFMQPVGVSSRSLKEKGTLLVEHRHLNILADALKRLGGIEGPLCNVDVLSSVTDGNVAGNGNVVGNVLGVDGNYIIKEDSMIRLFEECSMKTADNVIEPSYKDQSALYGKMASVFLSTLVKIRWLRVERDSKDSCFKKELRPVLPNQIYDMKLKNVYSVMKQ